MVHAPPAAGAGELLVASQQALPRRLAHNQVMRLQTDVDGVVEARADTAANTVQTLIFYQITCIGLAKLSKSTLAIRPSSRLLPNCTRQKGLRVRRKTRFTVSIAG